MNPCEATLGDPREPSVPCEGNPGRSRAHQRGTLGSLGSTGGKSKEAQGPMEGSECVVGWRGVASGGVWRSGEGWGGVAWGRKGELVGLGFWGVWGSGVGWAGCGECGVAWGWAKMGWDGVGWGYLEPIGFV